MMNYIWVALIAIAVVVGAITGNLQNFLLRAHEIDGSVRALRKAGALDLTRHASVV